jgi:hypothetical protein
MDARNQAETKACAESIAFECAGMATRTMSQARQIVAFFVEWLSQHWASSSRTSIRNISGAIFIVRWLSERSGAH